MRAAQTYRDSRSAEQARRQEWEGNWQAPRSESVRRLVAGAFAGRPRQTDEDQGEVLPAPTDADDFGADDLADLRTTASGEFMKREATLFTTTLFTTTLFTTTVDVGGRPAAEWICDAALVQRALRHQRVAVAAR
ncbi:hypothetical protein [Streptomyces sp. x-80]|uniref:hypothetical protein n=1 Tax=Streptomyces sp. x-80 TaxID=2789282 RepID=UPI00397F0F95